MFMGEWEWDGWEQREKVRRGGGKEGKNEVDVGWFFKKKPDCVIRVFVVYSSWKEILNFCLCTQFIVCERGGVRGEGEVRQRDGEVLM